MPWSWMQSDSSYRVGTHRSPPEDIWPRPKWLAFRRRRIDPWNAGQRRAARKAARGVGFWRFFTPSGHVCIIYSFCSGGSDSEPGASIFPIQQGAEELQGVPRWTDVEPSMEPGGTTILEKGKCCFMEILETPRCTFGLSCIGLCFLNVSLTDA